MSIETSRQVARHLETLPGVLEAKPVVAEVGDEKLYGALYRSTMTAPTGSANAGKTYEQEALYIVGEVPKVIRKGGRTRHHEHKTVLTYEGRDWYVAAGFTQYMGADFDFPDREKYHPFGQNHLLMPWTLDDPIDKYEDKPRTRVPLTVTVLD